MFGEGLGAIAALQQERFTGGDFREHPLQLARLAGEDERREAGELALDIGKGGGIGIVRHLLDGQAPPAFR